MKLKSIAAAALMGAALFFSSCSQSPVDEVCSLSQDYIEAVKDGDTERAADIADRIDKAMEQIDLDKLSDSDREKIQSAVFSIIGAEFDSFNEE